MSDISADTDLGAPPKEGKSFSFLNNAFHVAVGFGAGLLSAIWAPAASGIIAPAAAVTSKEICERLGKNPGVAIKDFLVGFTKSPDGP